MDVESARTFLEIVRTGSFVAAAGELNLTQTAVGARMRALEDRLGRPLFVRSKAGARLTPAGERFLRPAMLMVQAWERARQCVELPPGRESIVAAGAELSLWTPLLRDWILAMRRDWPELALRAKVAPAATLLEEVRSGLLDVAIVYDVQPAAGLVVELLCEEKLVLVRAAQDGAADENGPRIFVDWGAPFAASYHAAFPNQPAPDIAVSYGPLALDYVLAGGGSGYFRMSIVRPHLAAGRLALAPDAPEFQYSAYAVRAAGDSEIMRKVRAALRSAVQA